MLLAVADLMRCFLLCGMQRDAEQSCSGFAKKHRSQVAKDLDDSRTAYNELLRKVAELSRHKLQESGSIDYYKQLVSRHMQAWCFAQGILHQHMSSFP